MSGGNGSSMCERSSEFRTSDGWVDSMSFRVYRCDRTTQAKRPEPL